MRTEKCVKCVTNLQIIFQVPTMHLVHMSPNLSPLWTVESAKYVSQQNV